MKPEEEKRLDILLKQMAAGQPLTKEESAEALKLGLQHLDESPDPEDEEPEHCCVCDNPEPHDHDFDKENAELEAIARTMGTANPPMNFSDKPPTTKQK
jgi:hypothetical protein